MKSEAQRVVAWRAANPDKYRKSQRGESHISGASVVAPSERRRRNRGQVDMAGLPPKSDAARLLALVEYSGDKLPVALRNEIKSYQAALANVPAAINARAKAERDVEAAKKSADVDDITNALSHFKTGAFETLDLGPDALAVATAELAKAERYERAVKRAAKAAALNVGGIARRTKLADKLARYWRDVVLVDLDRDTTSYSEVADADRRSEAMAARILDVLIILDQPEGKYQASLLRDAVAARPPSLPRLSSLLRVVEDEKRGVAQKAEAAAIRRDTFRASADGRVVAGPMRDVDKDAVAKTAALRTGRDKAEVSK